MDNLWITFHDRSCPQDIHRISTGLSTGFFLLYHRLRRLIHRKSLLLLLLYIYDHVNIGGTLFSTFRLSFTIINNFYVKSGSAHIHKLFVCNRTRGECKMKKSRVDFGRNSAVNPEHRHFGIFARKTLSGFKIFHESSYRNSRAQQSASARKQRCE